MTELWHSDAYRAGAGVEIAAFTALAATADLAEPAPSCAGWTVAELVKHVGRIHRWVGAIVGRRLSSAPGRGAIDYSFPTDVAGYPEWLAQCSAELIAALDAADPRDPVWTWGPDNTVGWWLRRMLHENTIHRVDLELALGRTVKFDGAVPADGVDEFFHNLASAVVFAPDIAKLTGDGETILFRAADSADSWLITLRPDGFAVGSAGVAAPDAAVEGTAADLYRHVWGRPTAEPLTSVGDRDLLALWTTNSRI